MTTVSELQVKYVAPREHCSSVRMHFLLDGIERGASEPLWAGRPSRFFDFGRVSAGEHVVGLRAEGLRGGCNVGRLASWGGFAVVRSTVDSDIGLDPRADSLGAVIFHATLVNYAWSHRRQGIYVTAGGDVYAFRYEMDQRDWNPAPDTGGGIARFDLEERFSHHPRWRLTVDARELKKWEFVFSTTADTVHPTKPADTRYDASAEFLGAYRLDPATGRYIDVPICAGGSRPEDPSSREDTPLCSWLTSLFRLANQADAVEEK